MKTNRSMKVRKQSGYNYSPTPAIILKGNWLKEVGFEIGDYVSVCCENGKLVITPDTERARMIEAEKEFMNREMKTLRKKFEAEKEKIHLRFVAEQNAKYGTS